MNVLWIVIGISGCFAAYYFVQGFIEGLGIRRKPKLKVYNEENE